MRAQVTILLVLGLFSSTVGAPSLCAALCTAPMGPAATGEHDHHEYPADTAGDSVSANACEQHSAEPTAPPAMPCRVNAGSVPVMAGTIASAMPPTSPSLELRARSDSPPRPVPSLNPPLRI